MDQENMHPETLPQINIKPVGIIKQISPEIPELQKGVPGERNRNEASEILIDDDLCGILDGIEDFSHLLVLYWGHRIPEEKRDITKCHPKGRQDLPLVGVFSTHSPFRPNPILATVVELLERKGNVLKVKDLDALDGSPVLDIKTFTKSWCPSGQVKVPEWVQELHRGNRDL